MALNHRLAGQIAHVNEWKRNPDKTWANPIRHKCSVCGEIIEVGENICRDRASPNKTRHASC